MRCSAKTAIIPALPEKNTAQPELLRKKSKKLHSFRLHRNAFSPFDDNAPIKKI